MSCSSTRTERGAAALLLILPLAGCYTTPAEDDPVLAKLTQIDGRLAKVEGTLRSESLVQLVNQMQTLQAEVRELRGEVETARNDIDGGRKQQREQFLNLDGRIAALERGGAVAAAPAMAAPADSSGRPPAASAAGSTDAQLYDSSFELLKNGRYEEAAQGFKRLLETWPESSYAGNAQYWLAETLYVRRDFAKALPEFEKVVNGFPRSGKVGDALLKLGFCHYELGHWQEARAGLERVVERYPESSASRMASERLERMRREGH